MCNCSCGSEEKKNALLPQVGIITDIRRETPDVKTFRIVRPDGTKLFEHMPGQCAMLCVPGVGEALFSITSSPTNKEYQEFSIKECGTLTNYLHNMSVGDEILVRGPYGNHFPVETVLKGQDLLFIAGGIGNIVDRVRLGYVVDMFHFQFWPSYPTFNVADICIVCGAILGAVYYVLIYEKHDGRKQNGATDPASGQ